MTSKTIEIRIAVVCTPRDDSLFEKHVKPKEKVIDECIDRIQDILMELIPTGNGCSLVTGYKIEPQKEA